MNATLRILHSAILLFRFEKRIHSFKDKNSGTLQSQNQPEKRYIRKIISLLNMYVSNDGPEKYLKQLVITGAEAITQ